MRGSVRTLIGSGLVVVAIFAWRVASAERLQVTEAALCSADAVVVGTVTRRESFESQSSSVWLVSDVYVQIERVAHGDVGEMLRARVPGGERNGLTSGLSDFPLPDVGRRYLLFLTTPGERGARGIRRLYELNTFDVLLANEEMQAIWREHCGPPTEARPTFAHLEAIRASFGPGVEAICEHY